MKDRYSRRDILILAAAGAASALIGPEPQQRNPESPYTFDEMLALSRRFYRIIDRHPPFHPGTTAQDLAYWVAEIPQYFVYNRVSQQAHTPTIAAFATETKAMEFIHRLGKSDCKQRVIANDRYTNPHSALFSSPSFPAAVTHELAHLLQGEEICGLYSRVPKTLVENSAQIAALEIMASMACQGNTVMGMGLVHEIKDMATDSALYFVLEDPTRMEAYRRHIQRYASGAEISKREASFRYWVDDIGKRKNMLKMYAHQPLEMMRYAHAVQENAITGLAFPPVYPETYSSSSSFPSQEQLPIVLDDFWYFFNHAEEIVG